jgi:hypothetical protein
MFPRVKHRQMQVEQVYTNNFSSRVIFIQHIYDREPSIREYINELHHLT